MSETPWFDTLWRNNLVYNQCWEDPAVDRQALDLQPSDRLLVITSAGCNALDYALTGAEILAVDANPRQNHLLELKRAGIRALGFDAFFALFGEGGSPYCFDIYRALRAELPDAARDFWDREIRLFHPSSTLGRSFYFRGTAGLVALAMKLWIDHGARVRQAVDRILDADGLEQQLRLYHTEVRGPLLGDRLLRLVGSPGIMSLLGVPAPQRTMVHGHPGGFAGFLRSCLDRVMELCPLRDNYFWRVYLTGCYTQESCPEYLKRENFLRLKAGFVDRVQSFDGTVTECLAAAQRPFTAFVLLDHMDWLARHPRALLEEWTRIFAASAPNARIIFRSGGPDADFLPREVLRRLTFNADLAARLHARDRVGTYGSFHIARLAFA
jgi:S-adenosylmethionine-diacylglycerol 3-amino-3-carboxypropyl transferase